jgi:hypothetical protein
VAARGGPGEAPREVTVARAHDSRRPTTSSTRRCEQGALPSLKECGCRRAEVRDPRDLLTEGLLAAMHELRVTSPCSDLEMEPQLAALGLVRQLPALAKLEVEVCWR